MKFIDKVKSSKAFKKTIAVIASASLAMSAMAVNVFAAEGGADSNMYSSLIEELKSGFTSIVTNCVTVAGAVLPIGLGILGPGKLWDVAKKFFTKATS